MARRTYPNGNLMLQLHPMDCNVESMLWKSQISYLSGEGMDVGKQIKEGIKKMENYSNLAHSFKDNKSMMDKLNENKSMMGKFKLDKYTKAMAPRSM